MNILNVYNQIRNEYNGYMILYPILMPADENTNMICFLVGRDTFLERMLIYDLKTLEFSGAVSVESRIIINKHPNWNTKEVLISFSKLLENMVTSPADVRGLYSSYLVKLFEADVYKDIIVYAASSNPNMVSAAAFNALFGNIEHVEEKCAYWQKKILINYDKVCDPPVRNTKVTKPTYGETQPVKQQPVAKNRPEPANRQRETSMQPANSLGDLNKKEEKRPAVNTENTNTGKVEEHKMDSEPKKMNTEHVSILEQCSPALAAYNKAIERLKGRGLFRYIVFTNCGGYFDDCVEKEVDILKRKGAVQGDAILTDISKLKDKTAYKLTAPADKKLIDKINTADIFVFAKDGNRYNANVFDMKDAGLVIVESMLEKNGFEIDCELRSAIPDSSVLTTISSGVFINNTIMSHFTKYDDNKLKIDDFSWLKDYSAPIPSSEPRYVAPENAEPIKKNPQPVVNTAETVVVSKPKPVISEPVKAPEQPKPVTTDNKPAAIAENTPELIKNEVNPGPVMVSKPETEIKTAPETKAEPEPETAEVITPVILTAEADTDKVPDRVPDKPEPNPSTEEAVESGSNADSFTVDVPKDTEIRNKNIAAKQAIAKENSRMMLTLKAARNTLYAPIITAYMTARDKDDYKFRAATYATTLYPSRDHELYKSKGYSEVFESEGRIKALLSEITPVSRHVSCFGCRNKWDEDVSFEPDGIKNITCPTCGMNIGVEV